MQNDDTLSRAEDAFGIFVDLFRKGELEDHETYIAQQEQEIQGELRQMIEEFTALREQIGQGTLEQREGRVLGGYRLISELGRGGMSVVWEAEEIALNRRVALKVLAPHQLLSPTALERFEREARAGGRLTHPGIVPTYGAGEADGVRYISQELVPGGYTLAESFNDLRELRELPGDYYRSVAELFQKIADALQHAHDEGVIHRDVKPGNILISEDNEPRLADFGLARIQDELSTSRTVEISGTPFYMSPEQAAAKAMGIDERTDQFSLGASLYEALTLQRAFEGDTSHQVFRNILTVDPPDPRRIRSRVPEDLAVICLKTLEKNPEQRYEKIAELAVDLGRFLEDRPIHAKPPGALVRAGKWARRHRGIVMGLAMASVAFAVISLLLVQNRSARILAEETTKDLELAQGDLLASQVELLDAQRSLIQMAADSGQTSSFPSSFGDMSLDLVRRYIDGGEFEAAAEWLRAAPIPGARLDSLRNEPALRPLLDAGYSEVFDRKALPDASSRKVIAERPLVRSPEPIEDFDDDQRLQRAWNIPGYFRGVAYDDETQTLYGLVIGGECHTFDAEFRRRRSFVLAKGMIELRLGRLQPNGPLDAIGFGSTARWKVKASTVRNSLWTYFGDGRISDIQAADLDGDGRDEVLLGCHSNRGVHVLDARGEPQLLIDKVRQPHTVSTIDIDGDGQLEIAIGMYLGAIWVFDQKGERKGTLLKGVATHWLRPYELRNHEREDGELVNGTGLVALARKGTRDCMVVVLDPRGQELWRVPVVSDRAHLAAFTVDSSGRWAALIKTDYKTGRNDVTVVDLEERRVHALIDYHRSEDAEEAENADPKSPRLGITALAAADIKSNPASASQAAWLTNRGDGPPTLVVATKLGLRGYQLKTP